MATTWRRQVVTTWRRHLESSLCARRSKTLPSRSRAFRKTAPPTPELKPGLKPEEKENMHEKEEEAAEVYPHHQAHDAVAVVDLQAWQARGLARDAMRRDGAPSAGES